MLVVPISSEMVCNVTDDLPIRPAPCEWFNHFIKSLNSSFGAGERAFLFQTWPRREDDIGVLAGLAEKDFLHDEELELGEGVANIVCVGIDNAHLFADEVHSLELALLNRFNHLVIVQPFTGRKSDLPAGFK